MESQSAQHAASTQPFLSKDYEDEDEYDLESPDNSDELGYDREWNSHELRIFEKRKTSLIIAYLVSGFLFISLIVGSSLWYYRAETEGMRRNVILMISDGFGPASATYARSFLQVTKKKSLNFKTSLDDILVGQVRTRSSSSLITDSAAGATAYSCALKTYNRAIAVDSDKKPCTTVLEAAKLIGMKTGLVARNRITDATPAAFSSHVLDRTFEDDIAVQQIGDNPFGRSVDLMIGGGSCHYFTNNTNTSNTSSTNKKVGNVNNAGCRMDNRDIWSEAHERYGWNQINTKAELDGLKHGKLPLMALIGTDNMNYEIDREISNEPSLAEMALKAIKILDEATADSEQGFFLMIEGSRIDVAAHANDPAAHLHEILAYLDAVDVVRDYVDSTDNTVLISVSDHETGGFTLGRQINSTYPEYRWYPDVIERVKNSTAILARAINTYDGSDMRRFISKQIVKLGLGIDNATPEELTMLEQATMNQPRLQQLLGDMVSRRAMIGWTTPGHTGVDVNLYAYGMDSEQLRGNRDNTEIGEFITNFLGLSLERRASLASINLRDLKEANLQEQQIVY